MATRQSSEVTRPSADCQTILFRRFSKNGKILKKSLNGHATVIGGRATVGRLSNKVAERSRDSGRRSSDRRPTVKQLFSTFQAIRKNFEKSRWTVSWQSSKVTRPSADWQTTFFPSFKQTGDFFKKVAQRSGDSRRRSRDRRLTVK